MSCRNSRDIKTVIQNAFEGKRLTKEEAVSLFKCASLQELGVLADEARRRLHPDNIVTYVIDRNINYTNICESGCKFCAYYKTISDGDGFIITKDELFKKIEETLALGGTQILLQGGLHPDLNIEYYEDLFKSIKGRFNVHCHALSPPEIIHIAKKSGLTIEETLKRLKDAGLDSIPGGGAEILVDRVRKRLSPKKATAQQWLMVMETAHSLGIKTTATMMFGHIETIEERIEHLYRLRCLQDRTGGFTAFIPWPFQPGNSELNVSKATAYDYLKTLAISRIFLDNFKNIQASWVTQGPKVAQIALYFGANDFGSAMIEENVVKAAGVSYKLSVKEMRRLIKEAGFYPMQRRMDYSLLTT